MGVSALVDYLFYIYLLGVLFICLFS